MSDAVGGQRLAGFQAEARDGFSIGIESFDGDLSALCVCVENQPVAQEQECSSGHRASFFVGVDGHESVASQRGQADPLCWRLGVGVLLGRVTGPGPPVLGVGTRVEEVDLVVDDNRLGGVVGRDVAPVPVLVHLAVGQEGGCLCLAAPVLFAVQRCVADGSAATDAEPGDRVAAVGQLQVLPIGPGLVGRDRLQRLVVVGADQPDIPVGVGHRCHLVELGGLDVIAAGPTEHRDLG